MRRLIRRVGRFLVELKRRKVYRAAAFYVVVSVGMLEVLDILVPQTRLPDWSVPFFLSLAVVGLPLVLVVTWIYDITPQGVQRTGREPDDGGESPERAEALAPESDAGQTSGLDPSELDPRTVAVLPFENRSASEEAGPFVTGLHDDLLTELSRTSALRVISGSSVRAFEAVGRSTSETGVALGAGTVVQGSVQIAGNRVRLNIRMVDARTDAHRWAERYDRELSTENIFDLQAELAGRIRDGLSAQLTSAESARSPVQPTGDLEAYRLYVQGRRSLEEWSEESMRGAVTDFRSAVERDPDYAAAWSGLADGISLLDWYSYAPVPGAPSAGEAADRALALAPELAEAHVSKAIVAVSPGTQDATAALQALKRAVELRPSYAYAYIWIGWVHLILGDPAAGVEAARTAVRLDPLSPAAHVFLAEALLADGQLEEARKEVIRGREIQPGRPLSHLFEGVILHHLGRFEAASQAFERCRARVLPGGNAPTRAEAMAFHAVTLAARGDQAGLQAILDDPEVRADPFSHGLALAAAGEVEAGLDRFESVEGWKQTSTECIRYFYPEELGPVRASPRHAGLVESIDRSWGVGSNRNDGPGSGPSRLTGPPGSR
ncbi:MAG: tetratricopeptide repeat protein [Gemmatimonadota bacterium]